MRFIPDNEANIDKVNGIWSYLKKQKLDTAMIYIALLQVALHMVVAGKLYYYTADYDLLLQNLKIRVENEVDVKEWENLKDFSLLLYDMIIT